MNRYRLVLASGQSEVIENPFLIDISTAGVLVIYDQRNVITRAIAPGQWLTFEMIDDASTAPDVYGAATQAAGGGA